MRLYCICEWELAVSVVGADLKADKVRVTDLGAVGIGEMEVFSHCKVSGTWII